MFRLSIRQFPDSPTAFHSDAASGDGHDTNEPHESHPGDPTSRSPSTPDARWAELRTGNTPPTGGGNPIHGLPPTDGANRLNLLLSWGGWQRESWADRLPALLEPMGVHSLRVRTAREAERVIRTHAVHIAIVDFGLPLDASGHAPAAGAEESGPRVLELLRRLDSPPPTVVVQQPRTSRDASRHMSAALRCDAFAVVDRAAADVELMLKVLQRCLQRFYQGRWPGSP